MLINGLLIKNECIYILAKMRLIKIMIKELASNKTEELPIIII